MKKCPFCAEEIQDGAVKCRHCGGLLDPGAAPPPAPQARTGRTAPQTSGFAIASLVLGICWIYWVGSICALVFGYRAKREIEREPERFSGEGMARAGIVLGWVGMATLGIAIVILVLALLSGWRG